MRLIVNREFEHYASFIVIPSGMGTCTSPLHLCLFSRYPLGKYSCKPRANKSGLQSLATNQSIQGLPPSQHIPQLFALPNAQKFHTIQTLSRHQSEAHNPLFPVGSPLFSVGNLPYHVGNPLLHVGNFSSQMDKGPTRPPAAIFSLPHFLLVPLYCTNIWGIYCAFY